MKKMNKKGFTLIELLIVVAIIAILVAIAIPVLNGQLEKAREAADAANLRASYAEGMIAILEEDTDWTDTVDAVQTDDSGWVIAPDGMNIGDVEDVSAKKVGASWTLAVADDGMSLTIS